jgi:hypothetical protein
MANGTSCNGRYSPDQWTEGLLTGAGASLGRVLDERQRHAVNLALEVIAYLLAAIPAETMQLSDVIRLLKWYVGGINNAESKPE